MGNGALLQANNSLFTREDFVMLERLCKKQHFRDNFTEYRSSFQRAIENEAIDIIEILIPAGNSKKIFPLHLACKLAKLESAELLLSAGFSALHQDEHGRTPLHLCSISRSFASGLCASLLSISAKKTLTMRDRDGLTPLHLAAARNNLHVIEALMLNGADITVTTSAGKTAYQVAADNQNVEALQLLKEVVGRSNKREYTAAASKKSSNSSRRNEQKPTAESKVEYDRIMQVWERFFENAFKRLGIDVVEEEELEDPYLLQSQHSFSSTPATSARSCTSSSVAMQRYSSAYCGDPGNYEEQHSVSLHCAAAVPSSYSSSRREADCRRGASVAVWDDRSSSNSSCMHVDSTSGKGAYEGKLEAAHEAPRAIDWFQWVVCYQQTNEAADWAEDAPPGEYYVLNKCTGETCWLDEHIAAFARGTLLPCGDWGDYELHMSLPLPTSLAEAIGHGWLTYYAPAENECRWISLPTKSVEDYLPLGLGERASALQELELLPCEADPVWYLSDQSCAQAWVMVVASAEQDSHDSDGYYEQQATHTYFHNRITGETSWDPPGGWAELVAGCWHGWTLCCSEDSPYNFYWFDFESGESVWVQE